MRRRKIMVGLGYGVFAFAALVLCLYLTFPAEAVGQRLAQEVSKRTQGSVSVSFDFISPYRLSGIRAKGVHVRLMQAGEQPRELTLSSVSARLRLLPLLWLAASVDATVELGAGSIGARLTPRRDGSLSASLDIDGVKLSDPPLFAALLGLQVDGVVDGALTIDWSTDVKKSSGKATLKLAGAQVEGSIEGFTLPRVGAGNVELELVLEAGKLRVASFKQQGGDLEAKLSGTSLMNAQVANSSLDFCLEVKPDPQFLDRDPKMKAVAQLAEVSLRKSPQGFLDVPLTGTLGSPRLRAGLCH